VKKLVPVYHKTNVTGLQGFLRGKFASCASNDSCVEEIWKSFKEIVFESIDRFVPHKILRKNPDPEFCNKEVKRLNAQVQRRKIARLCSLFKAYSGKRAWKPIRDRLRRTYYLSRVDHVRKIRDRKQRTDIGKYSFVIRTIKNWKQILAKASGTLHCKPKIFRNRVSKAIINGVK